MSRFYVTTPIYYVNDVPHLGHVVHDDRRGRAAPLPPAPRRRDADAHGHRRARAQARARGAASAAMPPAAFVEEMSARFEAAWPKLEMQADDFIRTTEPRHEKLVAGALGRRSQPNPETSTSAPTRAGTASAARSSRPRRSSCSRATSARSTRDARRAGEGGDVLLPSEPRTQSRCSTSTRSTRSSSSPRRAATRS